MVDKTGECKGDTGDYRGTGESHRILQGMETAVRTLVHSSAMISKMVVTSGGQAAGCLGPVSGDMGWVPLPELPAETAVSSAAACLRRGAACVAPPPPLVLLST